MIEQNTKSTVNSLLRMKKILFIRNGYYPDDPRLKKQVLALVETGHKVDVLCLKKNGQMFRERISKNLTILRLPFQHKRSNFLRYLIEYTISFIFFFVLVSFLYPIKRYDFIVIHTLPDFLSFSAVIPKIFGAKIITDFHEPTPELVITKFNCSNSSVFVKLTVFFEQSVIAFSNLNITVTKALRNRYIERGGKPEKIVVISNAVDTSELTKISDCIVVEKNHSFKLITHGSIEERYGHELVINGINLLKDKFPNIKYIITGTGTYENHLKNLVKKLNLNQHVEFKGFLSLHELIRVLKESDIGVIPMYSTPYSELIDTNKMYEYFELNIPVVVPKLKPLLHSYSDNEVIFFEPGDVENFTEVVSIFINNYNKLQDIAFTARKKYEKIRWENEKVKFVRLFND